jgi:lipid-binding SYLF domain-containing protein
MNLARRLFTTTLAALALTAAATTVRADDAKVIDTKVRLAMEELFASVPGSQDLFNRANGVLIMPEVTKAGLIVGGAYGEGALLINGATTGYYSVAAASIGFQIGIQQTKHALFFLTQAALEKFRRADGWELGADAEFTVPDDGVNINVSTKTSNKPVILVVFGQDGLMAGVSMEGSKYSLINR